MTDQNQTPWWETIAIILAVFSLWPVAFRVKDLWAQIPMYVMLAVMVWVLIRRIHRFVRVSRQARKQAPPPL